VFESRWSILGPRIATPRGGVSPSPPHEETLGLYMNDIYRGEGLLCELETLGLAGPKTSRYLGEKMTLFFRDYLHTLDHLGCPVVALRSTALLDGA
jgi:hypothetical protein